MELKFVWKRELLLKCWPLSLPCEQFSDDEFQESKITALVMHSASRHVKFIVKEVPSFLPWKPII